MLQKLATLALLKIKLFWNKGYDVIMSVYEVKNKILSLDSIYIVNVVMWSKFGKSSTSMKEVTITSTSSFGQLRTWPKKALSLSSGFSLKSII